MQQAVLFQITTSNAVTAPLSNSTSILGGVEKVCLHRVQGQPLRYADMQSPHCSFEHLMQDRLRQLQSSSNTGSVAVSLLCNNVMSCVPKSAPGASNGCSENSDASVFSSKLVHSMDCHTGEVGRWVDG